MLARAHYRRSVATVREALQIEFKPSNNVEEATCPVRNLRILFFFFARVLAV
jgi:hypothetical protein